MTPLRMYIDMRSVKDRQFTILEAIEVEIGATRGVTRMLEPAVI